MSLKLALERNGLGHLHPEKLQYAKPAQYALLEAVSAGDPGCDSGALLESVSRMLLSLRAFRNHTALVAELEPLREALEQARRLAMRRTEKEQAAMEALTRKRLQKEKEIIEQQKRQALERKEAYRLLDEELSGRPTIGKPAGAMELVSSSFAGGEGESPEGAALGQGEAQAKLAELAQRISQREKEREREPEQEQEKGLAGPGLEAEQAGHALWEGSHGVPEPARSEGAPAAAEGALGGADGEQCSEDGREARLRRLERIEKERRRLEQLRGQAGQQAGAAEQKARSLELRKRTSESMKPHAEFNKAQIAASEAWKQKRLFSVMQGAKEVEPEGNFAELGLPATVAGAFEAVKRSSVRELGRILQADGDLFQACTESFNLLTQAAALGNAWICRTLLDWGMDPNRIDPGGKSAFARAFESGSAETMDLLFDRGACPNLKFPCGDTLAHWMVGRGQARDLAGMVKRYGLDLSVKGRDGQSALEQLRRAAPKKD